ncbi:alpha/beta hydrolase [Actinokineospora bangkokensis]|uniref:Hydrolase n=1 Tax=Actinokineospora bangkokensis TaxID=1193682 RepID=A0A1Q9LJT9_9PSEU|nr:alpha/beta hydrolase [Actinokineospora bangkokensis]OLR92249.1 hydrolase [Actinokineospora bangkokensis]
MKRNHLGRTLALAVALGLTGSLAAAPATAQPAPTTRPQWGPCPADVASGAVVLECATVPVPLDYTDPGGTAIDIMISRLPSTDPGKRRGVLLLNPGGPGGSGLSLPATLSRMGIPDSVLDAYDLIGMDTRGIGHSAPVSCGFTVDQDYRGNVPPYAVDDAAVLREAEKAKAVADQCAAHDTGDRLRHLTTANTARDLDRVRAALGEEKASYLGYSYGSALGAAYASLFPDRTDRVVLDSNIGDTYSNRESVRRFALGFEQTFPDFARWMADRHGAYGLGRTPEQVRATYFRLAEKLDEQPLPDVDGPLFRFATFFALYGKTSYGLIAQLWQHAQNATATAPAAQAPGQLSPNDNGWAVYLAVTCNDSNWPEDIRTYQRGVAEDRRKYPMFGASPANVTPCAFWHHEPSEPPVPVNDNGPTNILVVQNLRDPATPLLGGKLTHAKFPHRSRLLPVDASGHGAYVFGDNACALSTTTAFLVDGKLPARGKTCAATPSAFDTATQRQRAEVPGGVLTP